jgi:hypothetical protein
VLTHVVNADGAFAASVQDRPAQDANEFVGRLSQRLLDEAR